MIEALFVPQKPAIILPRALELVKPGDPRFKIPKAMIPGLGVVGLCGGGGAAGSSVAIGTPYDLGTGTGAASTASSTFTLTNAVVNGDLMVFGLFGAANASLAFSSVQIGAQTSTRALQSQDNTNDFDAEIHYLLATTGYSSGATVTFNYTNVTGGKRLCMAFGVSGIAASPVDASANAQATTTTASPSVTASGSLAQSNEILAGFSAQFNSAATFTDASGWTTSNGGRMSDTLSVAALSFKKVSSTTAPTYNPVWSLSKQTITLIVPFKGF